jgi:hypothetical protein
MSINTNYNGRQANNTSYVKEFFQGTEFPLWTTTLHLNTRVIIPASKQITSLYIPGDLTVDGTITNPSDEYLKENIITMLNEKTNKLMDIRPTQFSLKSDPEKNVHYGFIAQEFEQYFPELVVGKPDKTMKNLKAINYLEIIPLLVHKMQLMQNEIDELKMTQYKS